MNRNLFLHLMQIYKNLNDSKYEFEQILRTIEKVIKNFRFLEGYYLFEWKPKIPDFCINESSLLPLEDALNITKLIDSFVCRELAGFDNDLSLSGVLDVRIGIGSLNNKFHIVCEPVNVVSYDDYGTIDKEIVHFHKFDTYEAAVKALDKVQEIPDLKYWTEIPPYDWPYGVTISEKSKKAV
ncbi:hypothetical protein [Endozoicomonas sp. ONNA1]|uniref:hypothetical protein n=1 Tax=Endozoicomonas sp. ONNA1 TaxID=2828740 RepID=UPI002147E7C7|nr:hypothetical protein [Endozoicomonas sp. ONNA1]